MYCSLCIVLVLFAGSATIFTVAEPVNVLLSLKQCREEHNISYEVFRKLVLEKHTPEMEDPKRQCFVACFLEKTGMLKSDDTVDATVLSTYLRQEIKDVHAVTEELEKCADQPGVGCSKKYKIALCIERVWEENRDKYRNFRGMGKRSAVQ